MSKPIVILHTPSHSGNIGATARAMKTMGLSTLRLIQGHAPIDATAYQRSSHATDILDQAISYPSLAEACADVHWCIACTARPRHIKLPVLTAEEAAQEAHNSIDEQQQVAFLFGSERTGLANEDLNHANAILEIPTNPDYRSLNLAQAVQIVAYEWQKQCPKPCRKPEPRADGQAMHHLLSHFHKTLNQLDFFPHKNPEHTMAKLTCLFNRSGLSADEVALLRGMLTAMNKHLP